MSMSEMAGTKRSEAWGLLLAGLGERHPIFVSVLGICSTLAVTTAVRYAAVMAGIVTVTLLLSALIVSLLRRHIPAPYRIITSLLLISTPVILLEKLLRLHAPAIAGELGPYVGLVITNCIILGRIEACASLRPPKMALADALGAALGYGSVLIVIAAAREFLGTGRVMGYMIAPAWYPACAFFQRPAGAFLALALTLALFRHLRGLGTKPGSEGACGCSRPEQPVPGNGGGA